jgi:osmotically-inducible protein OsmY
LLLGGAPSLAVATATPDSWITTKTKIALLTSESVSGTAVNVDTTDGQVTLHGKVESGAEKAAAESIARKVEGVKGVRNLLQVVPESTESAVQATDDEIDKRVKQAFEAHPSLDDGKIAVQSVNRGVVLLGGKAESLSQHLEAIRTARGIAGVRRVESEVRSPDRLADDQIRRMPPGGGTPRAADRDVGEVAGDLYITSATKLRLLADSATPALDINVDTSEGVVTLFGIVPSQQAKEAAGENARKVRGVKQVVNELQVVPKREREITEARDAEVQEAVEQALENRRDLDDASITVEVKDGVARLSGTVANEDDRLAAAITARSTRGVRSVLWNDLQISKRS